MVSRKTPGENKVLRQKPQTLPASLGEAQTAFSALRTNLKLPVQPQVWRVSAIGANGHEM